MIFTLRIQINLTKTQNVYDESREVSGTSVTLVNINDLSTRHIYLSVQMSVTWNIRKHEDMKMWMNTGNKLAMSWKPFSVNELVTFK